MLINYRLSIVIIAFRRNPRILTAAKGRPRGLIRNAITRRISPFWGEYVRKTVIAKNAKIELISWNRMAEQEIIPTQIQVKTSRIRTMGSVITLMKVFIWNHSFSLLT